jgi:hypothetical protein
MRYRVFGANDAAIEPAPFLEHLRGAGFDVTTSFRGDEHGWFEAEMHLAGEDEPIKLERFLASEEGVRHELHTWIAWLETIDSSHQDRLIRQLVGTKQIFILSLPDDIEQQLSELYVAVCRYLAQETGGIYQMDGHGFFQANGDLLLKEE